MPLSVAVDEVVARCARALDPPLVAIDGLPCSGKSTLAETLQAAHGFDCLPLDDFVRPKADWPSRRPAFPFEYIRYDEFLHAVATLASAGECSYAPFDWETLAVAKRTRTVRLSKAVIVEGVSRAARRPDRPRPRSVIGNLRQLVAAYMIRRARWTAPIVRTNVGAMRVLPILLLAGGCALFGGRSGRPGSGEPTTTELNSHLDVTLLNHCAHPVEVCYARDTCLVLPNKKPHVVHAPAEGNEVFVRLKDSPVRVSADETFYVIEIDSDCTHLERRTTTR